VLTNLASREARHRQTPAGRTVPIRQLHRSAPCHSLLTSAPRADIRFLVRRLLSARLRLWSRRRPLMMLGIRRPRPHAGICRAPNGCTILDYWRRSQFLKDRVEPFDQVPARGSQVGPALFAQLINEVTTSRRRRSWWSRLDGTVARLVTRAGPGDASSAHPWRSVARQRGQHCGW
jgi:hypothetical protein